MRVMQNGRWLLSAIAFVAFGALPVVADMPRTVPDQQSLDLIARLETLGALATDPAFNGMPVAAMIATVGIADFAPPQTLTGHETAPPLLTPSESFEAHRVDARLALTPILQAYGAGGTDLVLQAQTHSDMDALVIRSGRVTLDDLRVLLRDQNLQDGPAAGPLRLKVPLVILAGAGLLLGPGDVLELSREHGAFVVNFGDLQMQGATISATRRANAESGLFRPFVTTADNGTLNLQGAHIVGLGFGETSKFSGFSVLRSILRAPDRPTWIENTVFQDLVGVSISADTDIVLRGNRFRDMRGNALSVSRTYGANILGNLFLGAMPTNAIRLEEGSADGVIAGNIILGGERTGIVVRHDSDDATVAQNIVWNRNGGGITLNGADCALISENLVIANRQKGIEVRYSQGAEVSRNTVFSNDSAGIWISSQPQGARTMVSANVVSFNGSGVAGADTALILMDGNDFSLQYQQFLSGDLAMQTPVVARNMRGLTPFTLTSAGRADAAPENDVCTDQ